MVRATFSRLSRQRLLSARPPLFLAASSSLSRGYSFALKPLSSQITPQARPSSNISAATDGSNIPEDIRKLSLQTYHEKSDKLLDDLLDKLEELSEEHPDAITDVDYSQGVLTIVVPKLGTYVINKQPPNKQIWLSSPVSGPGRYDFYKENWISLRDSSKLLSQLSNELSSVIGPINISL